MGIQKKERGGVIGIPMVYTYDWFPLIYGRNQHYTVKELFFNFKTTFALVKVRKPLQKLNTVLCLKYMCVCVCYVPCREKISLNKNLLFCSRKEEISKSRWLLTIFNQAYLLKIQSAHICLLTSRCCQYRRNK